MTGAATSESDAPWDDVYDVKQRADGLYEGKWRVHDSLPTEHTVVFKQDHKVLTTSEGRLVYTNKTLVQGPDQLNKRLVDWTRPLTNRAKCPRMAEAPRPIKPRFRFTPEEDRMILHLVKTQGISYEVIAKEINKTLPPGRDPRHRNAIRRRHLKLVAMSDAPADAPTVSGAGALRRTPSSSSSSSSRTTPGSTSSSSTS